MKYLGFSYPIEVVFGHSTFVLFQKHLKELREFSCLVSIDRLFHCRSVDSKKEL